MAFDGTTIASGSWDRTVRIWRAPYNTAECECVMEKRSVLVFRVWLCTTPNEHIAVIASWANRVYVHDIRTCHLVYAPIDCYCKLS